MSAAVKLASAPNFRAVAGYDMEGGRIRAGRLFRSQGLHALSDSDLAALRTLDVRLVCDLRNARERALHVSRWPAGLQTHVMTVNAEAGDASRELLDLVRADPGARGARAMMLANYERFPARFAPTLTEFFSRLVAQSPRHGLPALVHCSVGKDRTGFIVAVLLAALEVPREAIYEDYRLTEDALTGAERVAITDRAMAAMHGFVPDRAALEVIASVNPDFLLAAFRAIDAQFGSLDAYLSSACGLQPASREALRHQLLET